MDEEEPEKFPAALVAGWMPFGTYGYLVHVKHIKIYLQKVVARVFNRYNGNDLLLLSGSGWQCQQRA